MRELDERMVFEAFAKLSRDFEATGIHTIGLFRIGGRLILRGPGRLHVDMDPMAASMSVAERVQEELIDELDEHCWPRCPHANHPLWAKGYDADEVWHCAVHNITHKIGELPNQFADEPDEPDEFAGVTVDPIPVLRPPAWAQQQMDDFLADAPRGAAGMIVFAPPPDDEREENQ